MAQDSDASDRKDTGNRQTERTVRYRGSAGGWGSVRGMGRVFAAEWAQPGAIKTLAKQNKPDGVMCTSCSWSKPADYHTFEFCENGAKATLWELTSRRCTPDFFAEHTLTELRDWADYDLEQAGRLTAPLRYDRDSDRYLPCSWEEAFAAIGRALKPLPAKSAVFYASGRAMLETSYIYALLARLYGNNNLPDSSNMCHETTSVALKKTIGIGVGTVVHSDLAQCDAMFFFGQNPGSNSPRLLHPLQDAVRRGARIVVFNPVRERGLERFVNPQNPLEMVTGSSTELACQYHQTRPGGDIAAILGLCKEVFALDAAARKEGRRVLDDDFIAQHTHGFDALRTLAESTGWDEIEAQSGLARADLAAAARVYAEADKVIAFYGMGLTQHVHGFDNVAMLVNFMLLRGNVGREGTGLSPVRGHSNVQGQRTVGIATKPDDAPLDKFAAQFGFEPPREEGLDTVGTCKGVLSGEVKAFIGLGGNFLRAIPERAAVEAAWSRLRLTVQVATKLNRSHLLVGEEAYLLPCLGRTEEDIQATGPQTTSMEDTFSCIHASTARRAPASEHLKSEVAIVAGIAQATLTPNPKVPWQAWTDDYALIRAEIEKTYTSQFHGYEQRMWLPGGFYRGNTARERIWKTASGKAEFTLPAALSAAGFADAPGRYRLITMRSNDQFNTTIYGFSDRLRGIEGTRMVLLMNPDEITRAGLKEGQLVTLVGDAEDGVHREAGPLRVTPFDLPDGCLGAYYPEMNPLIPVDHHDRHSHTPAAKSVPVRIQA